MVPGGNCGSLRLGKSDLAPPLGLRVGEWPEKWMVNMVLICTFLMAYLVLLWVYMCVLNDYWCFTVFVFNEAGFV